ncbi:hypothetical protein CAOG_07899 [Capsaspora owczarzaki ATCC 30864]|uniref:Trichome birefringence-like C-terminal domain-containing protein n=1 Tax=Capsaspora owczarzaki (strain ATCC 30864) TaxID=595528 RepID=A0A0D2WXC2_CAPO3|nr:hypothetical protein CAOG_07899 [Capsaspora owczarzaki ATCC 30864]KJE97805.1 hypothetical protein CAOG_007899 [Capsaspora owczarzaki ATCC 30864]|eukprot:XP_004342984.1 hypothetical protein CAOG_07899 [Capsaspora owczarzaki ATCC 30864]
MTTNTSQRRRLLLAVIASVAALAVLQWSGSLTQLSTRVLAGEQPVQGDTEDYFAIMMKSSDSPAATSAPMSSRGQQEPSSTWILTPASSAAVVFDNSDATQADSSTLSAESLHSTTPFISESEPSLDNVQPASSSPLSNPAQPIPSNPAESTPFNPDATHDPVLPNVKSASGTWKQLPEDHPLVLHRRESIKIIANSSLNWAPAWLCNLDSEPGWFYESTDTLNDLDFKTVVSTVLTNKRVAIIGDSLNWQFGMEFVARLFAEGFQGDRFPGPVRGSFYFPSLNFTLFSATYPFLVEYKGSKPTPELNYTQPSKQLTFVLENSDYLVANIGYWLQSNNFKVPGVLWSDAYEKVVNSVVDTMSRRLDAHAKPRCLFRATAPRHHTNGDWNTGGTCLDTVPMQNATYSSFVGGMDNFVQNRILRQALVKDPRITLFDIVPPTIVRNDAHDGDCVHFCLPGGPIDVWIDMLLRLMWDERQS